MTADEPGPRALAAVLAGRAAPGVYRWPATNDVDDVRHAVELAGWRFAHLDGWVTETAAEFHRAIQGALGFPEHYGRNLDALADCLCGIDQPTVLLWDGWGLLARAEERTFGVAVEILGSRSPLLTVLLRGPGPDLAVASLG